MSHHLRTWGACALTLVLACSLVFSFSGFPALAEGSDAAQDQAISVQEPIMEIEIQKESADKEEPENNETSSEVESAPSDDEACGETVEGEDPQESPEQQIARSNPVATPVEIEETQPAASVLVEGSTVYANGVAICIKKDADGKVYVYNADGTEKLLPDPCSPSTVYGGGKSAPVEGDTSITIDGASVSTVYGGGKNASVEGSTTIAIKGAKVSSVYGGGYSDGSSSADVSGDATVLITGNVDAGQVHGGGYAYASKGNASADVNGAVTVSIPAQPTSNHGNIFGGGNAFSIGSNNASANVGSVKADIVGRTYSLRGGGSASLASGATGAAVADVTGSIGLAFNNVDIREVYGAGSADGPTAHATAGSVSISIDGTEAMSVTGGGTAYKSGVADVYGATSVEIRNCSNLYGYIYGGGEAHSGGKTRVGSARVSVESSTYPVDEQFPEYYAAGSTIAGGMASGQDSDASVLGDVFLSLSDCESAGGIYGGGRASQGGRATVGNSDISLARMTKAAYEGMQFSCSLIAGGEADDSDVSTVDSSSISVSIEDCSLEYLVGGFVVADEPVSTACASTLDIIGSGNRIQLLACFDAASLSSTLYLDEFVEKAAGKPLRLTVAGISKDDPVVVCKGDASRSSWFSRVEGSLRYAIEHIDGQAASVWRLGEAAPPSPGKVDMVVSGDSGVPAVSVDVDEDFAERLLTDEDRTALRQGSLIEFFFRADGIDEIPAEVAPVVAQALEKHSCTLLQHVDVSLIKSVDGTETPISSILQAGLSARFSVDVPQDEIIEGRTFSVLRFHVRDDGTVEEKLLPDLDDDPATVTFETDRFSVYSVVYTESGHDGDGEPGEEGKPENPGGTPGTGDESGGGADGNRGADDTGKPASKTGQGNIHRLGVLKSSLDPSTGDVSAACMALVLGVSAIGVFCACAIRLRAGLRHRRR